MKITFCFRAKTYLRTDNLSKLSANKSWPIGFLPVAYMLNSTLIDKKVGKHEQQKVS